MALSLFLPTTRAEMDVRGWLRDCDGPDIVLVSGDAYIDHPSFAAGLIGRLLDAAGYKVAILAQPDWMSVDAWRELGRPRLFYGVTAGNMDSMINHYTANRKRRNDDAWMRERRDSRGVCSLREVAEGAPGEGVDLPPDAELTRLHRRERWYASRPPCPAAQRQ